jgi:hypothetical protein
MDLNKQETVTDDAARTATASLTRGFFTAFQDNGWIETHGMPSTTASMAFNSISS